MPTTPEATADGHRPPRESPMPSQASLGVSPEFQSILDGLGAFIDGYVIPLETRHASLFENPQSCYTESGAYSVTVTDLMRDVRRASADAGYYTMLCPANIGGGNLGSADSFRVWEYLHVRYGAGRILPYQAVSHWTTGPSYLYDRLAPETRKDILPRLMSGESTTCFAMSEPDAGSDAWAMNTSARLSDGRWVLNGTKQWISNGPLCQYALVFAVTDEAQRLARRGGITCFLVPIDTPGFNVDSVIKIFGHGGGNEAILSMTNVTLSADDIVGELHEGFPLARGGVALGRMYNAGRAVGLSRWALEMAIEYAKSRKTFGRPLADHQAISFYLAECAMDIYMAKAASLTCARSIDNGEDYERDLALVKAIATEACFRVLDRSMQVHGAMGLTNELKLFDGWQQARQMLLADGSAEIMRRNVARSLMRGDVSF